MESYICICMNSSRLVWKWQSQSAERSPRIRKTVYVWPKMLLSLLTPGTERPAHTLPPAVTFTPLSLSLSLSVSSSVPFSSLLFTRIIQYNNRSSVVAFHSLFHFMHPGRTNFPVRRRFFFQRHIFSASSVSTLQPHLFRIPLEYICMYTIIIILTIANKLFFKKL